MDIRSMTNYVNGGIKDIPFKFEFREQILLGPGLFVAMGGILPGILLLGKWLVITLFLVLVILCGTILTFIYSAKEITLKNYYVLKTILYITFILVNIGIELMYFSMWNGFHLSFLLCIAPIILIPLVMGLRMHRILMRNEEYRPYKALGSGITVGGFMLGISSRNFAAMFGDVEQSTAIIIILVCLTIVNSVVSIGLLSVQKLYYINKYNLQFQKID